MVQRSDSQNKSLHLWFRQVADELNAAGFSVNHVLAKKVELNWNERLVKEILWRELQQRLLGKKSTTELEKAYDIDQVWETLNRHLGQEFGVHVPFPVDSTKISNSPSYNGTSE